MTVHEVVGQYACVEQVKKADFLLWLAHSLTVELRGCYGDAVTDEVARKKLTGANELQHHLSAEAGHHLRGNAKRYPDDVLINILAEKAAFYSIGSEFATAWYCAIEPFLSSKKHQIRTAEAEQETQ